VVHSLEDGGAELGLVEVLKRLLYTQYKATLPDGTGNIRYFVKAVDNCGNISYSPVGKIYIV
jgi:hypothetical protein